MITASKISHFLLQLYIIKSNNFHPTSAFNYEFHTLSHPTIFLTALRRSKECLSIPAGTQENLQPIPLVPLINIRPSLPLRSIICRGVQSLTWKTQSQLRSQFPPEMTLLKSQQNSQTCLKSNFLFTPVHSNIYFKRFSRWLESS